jgi:hypothetical protein
MVFKFEPPFVKFQLLTIPSPINENWRSESRVAYWGIFLYYRTFLVGAELLVRRTKSNSRNAAIDAQNAEKRNNEKRGETSSFYRR